jgi:ABC-type transport system substrate-binding protein/DNA-binding SARP family transcriptional activator
LLARVEFRLLGPLTVLDDGRPLVLGGPKQRAALAMLLLNANAPVSRDRLLEAVWGDEPPPGATRSLDSYVSRLRGLLGDDRIVRQAPGYSLRVDAGELDLVRFDALVEQAAARRAAGEGRAAAAELQAALALWRGAPLADLASEPVADAHAQELEERRLHALEQRVDVDLELGEGAALVPELQRLVREHPLRERLVGHLMLALYRAGRHSDALAAYAAARRRLADELGLDPGTQLRELERRILLHDDRLLGASPSVAHRDRRVRLRLVAAAVLLVAAFGGLAAVLALHDGGGGETIPTAGDHLLAFDQSSGRVRHAASLESTPSAIAVHGDDVWLTTSGSNDVLHVNARTGDVVDRIPLSGQPSGLAVGRRAVWVASTLTGTLSRIASETGDVTQTLRLGGADASAVGLGDAGLWVSDTTDHALLQIDPSTGQTVRTVTLEGRATALAVGRTSIWVADHDAGRVTQIDARSGRKIASVDVGGGPSAIVLAPGTLWVANSLDATVSRIDPQRGRVVATLPVGGGPSGLAVAGDAVWVANQDARTLIRIDARSNRVAKTIRTTGRPSAIAAGRATIWVGSGPAPATHRGGTLVLAWIGRFASIDPAFQNIAPPNQFGKLAYDTLVTLQAAGGAAGLRLVPDLAVALPTPENGGTVYTFRLRRGIRYSDGRPLRARDFRRAVERLFRVGSQGADYYSGVVGSAACTEDPAHCGLAGGIRTDDDAGTVEFRLSAPDPDFLYKLTPYAYSTPIPPGVPDRDVRSDPVPGTGPYRLEPWHGGDPRFVRNPYFHEWSHAAQPAGNPEVIQWRRYPSFAAAARVVEQGRADWIFGLLQPEQLRRLALDHPAQIHAVTTFIFDFLPLNTHAPPFDDVRVRRALNFAIDRRRIAAMYGGPPAATPTCQALPPGFFGYRQYCPYTVRPGADGAWRGPDIQRARRLVRASRTVGLRVDVWGASDSLGVPRGVPAYVASVLRSLGYRVQLHMVRGATISYAKRRTFQLSADGDWAPDYPAPSALLPPFFGCSGGYTNGYVCDRELERLMRAASSAQLRAPERAAALWAQVDRRIVDQAYWVPTVISHAPAFVSARLRNYQYNPIWDFVAGQSWVH